MSNVADAKASREEEIAFLTMERVLGVDIKLADAGAGDRKPDGSWVYLGGQERRGIVEITSPPSEWLMPQLARAKQAGETHTESGSFAPRSGELARVCAEMLATPWATENVDKLLGEPADERHLFLFGRRHADQAYFRRLSEPGSDHTVEHIEDLSLPRGISTVWFRGRAAGVGGSCGDRFIRVARFNVDRGWLRDTVKINERELPAPNRGLVDDPVPENWRSPKRRTGGDF